jgi:hypothetical protein
MLARLGGDVEVGFLPYIRGIDVLASHSAEITTPAIKPVN